MDNINDKFAKEEFDVDTGTYMEDVHSNDFVGLDTDSNGLIDNVEELIEKSAVRAQEYNEEQERIRQEQAEKTNTNKTDYDLNIGK